MLSFTFADEPQSNQSSTAHDAANKAQEIQEIKEQLFGEFRADMPPDKANGLLARLRELEQREQPRISSTH